MTRRSVINFGIVCIVFTISFLIGGWAFPQTTNQLLPTDTIPYSDLRCSADVSLPMENNALISAQPSISHNGNIIAFWSTGNFSGTANTNDDGNVEIFAWQPSSTTITITQVTSSSGNVLGGYNFSPAITDNGDFVSFISDRNLIDSEPNNNRDGNLEVFIAKLHADGTKPDIVAITSSREVSNRSPLLATSSESIFQPFSNKIYLPLIVQQQTSVLASARTEQHASPYLRLFFLSDAVDAANLGGISGNSLRNEDLNSEIFLVEPTINASKPYTIVQLTNTPSNVEIESFSISKDGSRFAYLELDAATGNQATLHISEPRTVGASVLVTITTENPSIQIKSPRLSSDGKYVIFFSNAENMSPVNNSSIILTGKHGVDHLFIVDVSIAQPFITLPIEGFGNYDLQNPSISEDGQRAMVLLHSNSTPSPYQALFFELNPRDKKAVGFYTSPIIDPTSDAIVMSSSGNSLAYVKAVNQNIRVIVSKRCPIANIILTTKVDHDQPNVGDEITYTIDVKNDGPDIARNIIVTYKLNSKLKFLQGSPEITEAEQLVTGTIAELAKDQPKTLTFTVKIGKGLGGLTIMDDIFVKTDTFNRGKPNQAMPKVEIPAIRLSASIGVENQTPKPTNEIAYTIVITNQGFESHRYDATGIVLKIAGLQKLDNPEFPGATRIDANTIKWEIDRLGVTSLTMKIRGKARFGDGGLAPFSVKLESLKAKQENKENNPLSPSIATVQVLGSRLELNAYTVDDFKPKNGAEITYSFIITNFGPEGQSGDIYTANKGKFAEFKVTTSIGFPNGLSCKSASAEDGMNTHASCDNSNHKVNWDIIEIPQGKSAKFSWIAKVIAIPGDDITVSVPITNATFNDGTDATFPKLTNLATPLTIKVNRQPTLTLTLESPKINEGQTAKLTVEAFDPDESTALDSSIDWGDGKIEPGNASTSQYTHVYADNPSRGKFTIIVTATDTVGLVATQTIEITVNRRPTIKLTLESPEINEGQTANLTVEAFDPDDAKFLAPSINWGDGTTQTGNANTSQYSHIYVDNPPSEKSTIKVTATDADGLVASKSLEITVKNVAPTLGNLNVAPDIAKTTGITTSTAITINPFFTDPSFPAEEYEYKVDWGDGTVVPFTKIDPKKNEFNLSHLYTISATYTIEVTVRDNDGGTSDPVTEQVYVHD